MREGTLVELKSATNRFVTANEVISRDVYVYACYWRRLFSTQKVNSEDRIFIRYYINKFTRLFCIRKNF